MTTPRDVLRAKLATRALVVGVGVDHPSTGLAEVLGRAGFDLVFIDCEHAGPGIERVADMVRAIRVTGAASVLRPWSNEPGLVRRFLDCGIDGLVAPQIESADQAEALVEVFAASADPAEGASPILLPLVETMQGVENVEAILRVPGVDGVQLGPGDLGISLGLPRRGDHARVRELSFSVFRRAAALGRSSGGPINRFDVTEMREAGVNILMVSANDLLRGATKQLLKSLRANEWGSRGLAAPWPSLNS
jgi:4-hydroxy-2-oxoheptanedioate aldolase